jgi:succinate dehydrogenase / fumarate reductase cytochrome b subunit
MNDKRPINLDLASLKFPPMAIASILHRISGLVLFLLLPIILYFLKLSLHSVESFAHLQVVMASNYSKLVLWAFSSALVYHIVAGFRHMFMDLGFGEHLNSARISSIAIIVLGSILTIILGVWIW